MKNPFGDQKIPGSYHNLKERMFKKVKAAKVDEQFLAIMMKAYEENVALSRPERKRLFSQIVQMIMEDALNGLDRSSSA